MRVTVLILKPEMQENAKVEGKLIICQCYHRMLLCRTEVKFYIYFSLVQFFEINKSILRVEIH